ncbi:MAG: CRISPR-associated protein [Myxococcaceae bacterium]|nr:CRISPR-associated protein [Myxococcaceae bacterium]
MPSDAVPSDAAVLFAPLGPNPAPFSELVWALHRQRGLFVEDAVVVVDREAAAFLDSELLAEGAALDQLRGVLGDRIVSRERLRVQRVVDHAGELLDDDLAFEAAAAYARHVWEAARAALALAGDRPVVFALAAGRRRTMTALATVSAELLARPGDLCLDVRVSDPRVEGGTGFFFPEQLGQMILTPRGLVRAADVEVRLVDVALPRLASLLQKEDLTTYASALEAGQRAIDRGPMPRLTLDLVTGTARCDTDVLPVSESELVWLAALAHARVRDPLPDGGWLAARDVDALRVVIAGCAARGWTERIRSRPLRALLADPSASNVVPDAVADLAKLRADTRKRISVWCEQLRPLAAGLLIPETRRRWDDGALLAEQRLALPGDRITILTGVPPR